jgi:thioredoxin reductase (NADPH)
MGRAFSQAQKFGVEILIPDEAVKLECGNDPCHVKLGTGERVQARSVVLATGARYRRLEVERLEEFEGSSVHYWASPLEADLCAEQEVALVGGGNSAGQAVVFLASRARKVTLVARRPLAETMSAYLVERIESLPNVDVVIGCEIAALDGGPGGLDGITIRQRSDGSQRMVPARFLFSFIGAEPNTDWLQSSGIQLNSRGFVLTGDEVGEGRLPLETNRHGVFAIGDVRCDSVKRVAAAVGDGAQVVAAIHSYLAKAPVHGVASAEPVPAAVS